MRSKIEPMKKVARTLRGKRKLILNWFRAEGRISAGIVEGFIDLCAANEPRAPSGSPDLASKMLAAGFICRATMNNNKLKLITRKSYGFRTQQAYEIAPYHNLGELPEREFTHTFL